MPPLAPTRPAGQNAAMGQREDYIERDGPFLRDWEQILLYFALAFLCFGILVVSIVVVWSAH